MLIFIEENLGWTLKVQLSIECVTFQKQSAFSSKFKDMFSLRYDEIHSVTVDSGFFSSKLILNNMLEPEIKFDLEKYPKLLKDLIDLGCVNPDELYEIIGDDSITYRLRDPSYADDDDEGGQDIYKIKYENYIDPDSVIDYVKDLKKNGAYDAPPMEPDYEPEVDYQQGGYADELEFMVSVDGQVAGPYTIDELQQFVATGEFSPQVFVWREGMQDWQYAGNVPELAYLF